jgi:hypothetical protein
MRERRLPRGNTCVFWLLPGALERCWSLARETPDAAWLHGGIRVVDDEHGCLAEVNSGLAGDCFAQIMGGAWIPIQASLILATAFFAVGGYDPEICGTEDLDLCRRFSRRERFANTRAIVACLLRGRAWDTSTDYLRAPDDTRLSRDQVLAEPGAFARLIASARADPEPDYWLGRVLRVYVSTVLWNVRRKRLFAAVSRAGSCLAGLLLSGWSVLSPDYWLAARAEHVPDTLHWVMEAFDRQLAHAK